jgi:glycosyltransferase involved in cell wall biosynthesis
MDPAAGSTAPKMPVATGDGRADGERPGSDLPVIGYILDHFPVYSETFIQNEILELEKRGYRIRIFARQDTRGHAAFSAVIHEATARIRGPVTYIEKLAAEETKYAFLRHHLLAFIRRPIRYLKTAVFVISRRRACRELRENFKFMPLLAHRVQKEGIAHLHGHFAWTATRYAMLIGMLSGIPFSFTAHAHDIFVPRFRDLIEDKCRRAKFVATISQFNKSYLLRNFAAIDDEKIAIVHCGISPKDAPANPSAPAAEKTILSVGRLVPQKGFRCLVHACAELKKSCRHPFVCKIVGAGPLQDDLEKEILKCGLRGTVQLVGALEHKRVLAEMSTADAFALPCTEGDDQFADGIPVVLMEAMSLGVPVVSTRISGIPELVREGAGILVPPDDAAGLAAALNELLSLDAVRRGAMAAAAQRIVAEEFNLETEVSKLTRLFFGPLG